MITTTEFNTKKALGALPPKVLDGGYRSALPLKADHSKK
jgi:hypothetical protein